MYTGSLAHEPGILLATLSEQMFLKRIFERLDAEYSPDHNYFIKSWSVCTPAAIYAAVIHGTHCNLVDFTPFT